MLRLNVSDVDLDLYQDEAVNLTIQFSDLEGINSPVGSFSQTFRVPGTAKNMDVFGPINTSDPGSVNLKTKKAAELFSGFGVHPSGVRASEGAWTSETTLRRHRARVLCGCGGPACGVGGQDAHRPQPHELRPHAQHQTCKTRGWAPCYPETCATASSTRGSTGASSTTRRGHRPTASNKASSRHFIRAKAIFDAIMDGAGYTYDSDFFDTTGAGNFDRIYLPAYNGAQSPLTDDAELGQVRAALDADYTSSSLNVLSLVDDATNGVDEGDNWDNTANDYTAPYTGLFTVDVTYPYSRHGGSPTNIYIYRNEKRVEFQLDTTETIGYNCTQTLVMLLVSGDTVDLRGEADGATAVIYGNDTVGTGIRTDMTVTPSAPMSGQTVRMARNMPEMSQIDFVVGLQRMFNLVFVPDKNRRTTSSSSLTSTTSTRATRKRGTTSSTTTTTSPSSPPPTYKKSGIRGRTPRAWTL